MAKIEIIRYQCDVCKAEFESEKELEPTHIPCYGGECNEYNSEVQLDLCKECSRNIRKIIYDNFADIQDYYGVHIRNKQKGV